MENGLQTMTWLINRDQYSTQSNQLPPSPHFLTTPFLEQQPHSSKVGDLLHQMIVAMKLYKLLMAEVFTLLIIIQLLVHFGRGMHVHLLPLLKRHLLVDQQRPPQNKIALPRFLPFDAELHYLRVVVKGNMFNKQMSVQMHSCFTGYHVQNIHLIVVGQSPLLHRCLDQPINGQIAHLPQFLVHALSELRLPLGGQLRPHPFLLPALHDLLPIYVPHYAVTIFKKSAREVILFFSLTYDSKILTYPF